MKLPGWILVAAVLGAGVVGFLAGRASGGVDDPALAAELTRWKHDARRAMEQRDSSRAVLVGLQKFVATVNAEAEQWRARALASERTGNQHQRQADSLLALLATAATPRDSSAILVNACTERGQECAAIRTANAELKEAAGKDSAAKVGLNQQIAEHLKQRGRDSTDLVRGDSLIHVMEKAVRGCRLPLVGLPCPRPLAEYSLDDQSVRVGGGMPVKLGPLGSVWLSVTTKVGGRKTP